MDTTRVRVVQITEPYFDYHWVAHPALDERFGEGTTERVIAAFLSLSEDPDEADLLRMFETDSFIETTNANYTAIEAVAESLGMLGEG